MHFHKSLLCTLSAVLCFVANAKVPQHEPDAAQRAYMQSHNARQIPDLRDGAEDVVRPFAEYETARFVLMSGEDAGESKVVKAQIAKHLPDGVDFVVLTNNGIPTLATLHNALSDYISKDRIHTIDLKSSGYGF